MATESKHKKETKAEAKAKDIATRERLGLGKNKLPKDIYQSFAFTVSRYHWSVYEKRIVYRLIEMAQYEIQGIKFSDGLHNVEPNQLMKMHEVTMPVQDILANEIDTNFEKAKGAFRSLAKKGCEYENDEIWTYVNIISKPTILKGSGLVKFNVYDEFWRLLLRFGSDPKGYRKYELLTAMSFDSVYSMRIYDIISGQKKPLVLTLENIKSMLQLTKRMADPSILEEKVLNVAKAELDEKAPYGFDYERNEVKSRGRNGKKVVGYTLTPYPIHANRNNALEMKDISAKLPAGGRFGGLLSPELYNYLTINLQWSKASVNANKQTLLKAQKTLPDILSDLSYFNAKARDKANPVGYVIQSIKNKVEQYEKDNERKQQETHETVQAPEPKPIQQPKQQPQTTAATVDNEDGKRKIQSVASILANNFSVKEQDMFNPSKSARPIPYKDKK